MRAKDTKAAPRSRWIVRGLWLGPYLVWRLLHGLRSGPAVATPDSGRKQDDTRQGDTQEVKAPAVDGTVAVPLSALVDVAVESWRLERWLKQLDGGQSNAAGRFVSRRLAQFVSRFQLETLDLTGQRYEPGLAVELLGNVHDETLPPDMVVVDEMVAPLCLWQGKVVRLGQVVTRSSTAPDSSGERS
jgi:hypothetical protein